MVIIPWQVKQSKICIALARPSPSLPPLLPTCSPSLTPRSPSPGECPFRRWGVAPVPACVPCLTNLAPRPSEAAPPAVATVIHGHRHTHGQRGSIYGALPLASPSGEPFPQRTLLSSDLPAIGQARLTLLSRLTMGRRATAEELHAQAEAKGYQRGSCRERDQVRHREKHVKKTIRDQEATLRRYVLYVQTPISLQFHRTVGVLIPSDQVAPHRDAACRRRASSGSA